MAFHGEVALVWRPAIAANPESGTAGFLKLVENIQNRLAAKLGNAYAKYLQRRALPSLQATLLNCEADQVPGGMVSRWFYQYLNASGSNTLPKPIDLPKLHEFVKLAFPLELQFGGYPQKSRPALLPAWDLYTLSFHFGLLGVPQFVLTGWPAADWGWQLSGLRSLVENANIMHKARLIPDYPPDADASVVIADIKHPDFSGPNPRLVAPPNTLNRDHCEWPVPKAIREAVHDVREYLRTLGPQKVQFAPENIEFVAYAATDPTQLQPPHKRRPLAETKRLEDLAELDRLP